jgi:hypothetical protein
VRSARVGPPGPSWLGLVATDDCGALAAIVGVARTLEESGASTSVYPLCSARALFGFPLCAGLSSDDLAGLIKVLRPNDVDVSWQDVARAAPALGRGWRGSWVARSSSAIAGAI